MISQKEFMIGCLVGSAIGAAVAAASTKYGGKLIGLGQDQKKKTTADTSVHLASATKHNPTKKSNSKKPVKNKSH